jgi:27-O-demethylrifamycin SV methyltransferase
VYEPAAHYDRVTAAWTLLLGEELHYGIFEDGTEDLAAATANLTAAMEEAAQLREGCKVLDVGCGTGYPACVLAERWRGQVTGITTSAAGIDRARERAAARVLEDRVTFEQRDGMDTGLPDASFDRVWALESSHLMRRRDRLMAECVRVLRPGGRLALCDIVLRRPMDIAEVKRLRRPLALLREVFGDARMEPLEVYVRLGEDSGLTMEPPVDLTAATRPTFTRWRENAARHEAEVVELLGERALRDFVEACDVLQGFWDDGTLGYGLVVGARPG